MTSHVLLVDGHNAEGFQLQTWLSQTRHTCSFITRQAEVVTRDSSHDAACVVLFLADDAEPAAQFEKLRNVFLPILATHRLCEPALLVKALHAGALDFLAQPLDRATCLRKIEAALELDQCLKSELSARNLRLHSLTEREREVLGWLVEAKTTLAIANRLRISPKTVEKHRTNILGKLNVSGVPELIRMTLTIPRPHYSVSLPRLPLESHGLALCDGVIQSVVPRD